MARAYVNFYARLDPGGHERGAQAFWGRAGQPHHAEAEVGADAAVATAIDLAVGAAYAEVCPTEGDVFVAIAPSGSDAAERVGARVRIGEGQRIALSRGLAYASSPATLYLWAA